VPKSFLLLSDKLLTPARMYHLALPNEVFGTFGLRAYTLDDLKRPPKPKMQYARPYIVGIWMNGVMMSNIYDHEDINNC
jgi:hypothetical protein